MEKGSRKISSKTLADVVEALIGASYIDGGICKALQCISMFIDDMEWDGICKNRNTLYHLSRDGVQVQPELQLLEKLAGYTFTRKSLLVEAVTHPSCSFDRSSRAYERLEFIGDAILDYIIVQKLFRMEPQLPHQSIHLLKSAMVNADFLAFLCLHHRTPVGEALGTSEIEAVEDEATPISLAIWNFMRHSSEPIGVEQNDTRKRFEQLGPGILAALMQAAVYPWALLANIQLKKFYSDLVESLLGAIWVDSGSIEECEAFLETLGLLPILKRLVRDGVQVQHPKEILGKLSGVETVSYEVTSVECGDGARVFACQVTVGGRIVAEIHDGVNREEAMTKAAEIAVRTLSSEYALDKSSSLSELGSSAGNCTSLLPASPVGSAAFQERQKPAQRNQQTCSIHADSNPTGAVALPHQPFPSPSPFADHSLVGLY